ncbi:hypothetical protein BDY21DRAFT_135395 [Lineolata rhizophorae]|uniref:Uncharacterized protein n=1 Tax=Lineolata rhizophorae TaxID=578093 RepID=A0A6A6PAE4_9PEZI|nr:hypothetical protein BDY21DRAFT_135395 [Lineolata rhizophorae]
MVLSLLLVDVVSFASSSRLVFFLIPVPGSTLVVLACTTRGSVHHHPEEVSSFSYIWREQEDFKLVNRPARK